MIDCLSGDAPASYRRRSVSTPFDRENKGMDASLRRHDDQCGRARASLSKRAGLTTRFFHWLFIAFAVFLLFSATAFAVEPSERLADPALEARARTISGELRCLVCQNESIDESGADLAHDIRIFVRQRLTAGDTDAQAMQSIVNRYGSFVLLKPPIEPATYVLWYGPPLLVAAGLVGAVFWLRRRQSGPAPDTTPLNAEETSRLAGLMRENDG